LTFDYLFVNGMLAIVPWAKDCLKPENRIVSVDVEEEDEEVDQGTWKRRKMEKVTTSLPYLEKRFRYHTLTAFHFVAI
jgi:hypothetical protein